LPPDGFWTLVWDKPYRRVFDKVEEYIGCDIVQSSGKLADALSLATDVSLATNSLIRSFQGTALLNNRFVIREVNLVSAWLDKRNVDDISASNYLHRKEKRFRIGLKTGRDAKLINADHLPPFDSNSVLQ